MRALTCLVLLLGLAGWAVGVHAQEDIEAVLQQVPAHERAVYRRQLVQLRRVSRRLLQVVPDPPQVQFTLVAGEPAINAGATFGQIIVTEGLLRFVHTDDELAMILGHELAHITQGHVSRGALNTTILGLGSLILGSMYPGVGELAGQVGQLFLNRFNQGQELVADEVGLRYAYEAGYDPQTAALVMERMATEVPETTAAGFFSSHPSSVERFKALQRLAAQLDLSPAEQRVVSDSRRRPLPERDEEACQRAKPYFYRASDAPEPQEKIALYQRGLRLCPQSPRAHAELAEAYVQLGDARGAAAEWREVLRYDPTYPQARSRLRELESRLSQMAD